MQSIPSVEILMTTYQGEAWLDVQLATIFAQTYDDWRLLIRDDGSTDRTRDIIRFWRDRFPDKVVFIDEQDPSHLGDLASFSALMSASSANYIMAADQDDVWYRDKVAKAVSTMQSLEQQHDTDQPLLVHTDLRMVDGNLREIQKSAAKHRGLKPSSGATIGNLCLENTAFGATLMMNRALIKLSLPRPQVWVHGDWWFALVAVAFGAVKALPDITVDYRRHHQNISVNLSFADSLRGVLNPLKHRRAFYEKLKVNYRIVQAFLDRFDELLTERDRRTLRVFLDLQNLGFWERRRAILRHHILFSSFVRTVGLLVLA